MRIKKNFFFNLCYSPPDTYISTAIFEATLNHYDKSKWNKDWKAPALRQYDFPVSYTGKTLANTGQCNACTDFCWGSIQTRQLEMWLNSKIGIGRRTEFLGSFFFCLSEFCAEF